MGNILDIQIEHAEWTRQQFPLTDQDDPFFGIVEEIGDLAHAHLKGRQHVRGSVDELHAKKCDALGDIFVFMCGYATMHGINLQDAIETTWANVRQRDYRKNPNDPDKGVDLAAFEAPLTMPRTYAEMTEAAAGVVQCERCDALVRKRQDGVCPECGA